MILENINWILVVAISLGLVAIVTAWIIIYNSQNKVYLITKRFILKNPQKINELIAQSSQISRIFSEKSEWIHRQIYESIFSKKNIQDKINRFKSLITSIDQKLEGLDQLYSSRMSKAREDIERLWNTSINQHKSQADNLASANQNLSSTINELEDKMDTAHKYLADSQKVKIMSWVDNMWGYVLKRNDKNVLHLESAVQSIISLWPLLFLLGVDTYFMYRAVAQAIGFSEFLRWMISFSLLIILVIGFELIYLLLFNLKKNISQVIRFSQTIIVSVITISALLGLYFVGYDRFVFGTIRPETLDKFGLLVLPIGAFFIAKIMHDYMHNDRRRKDALMVVLKYIIDQLSIITLSLLRPLFAIKPRKTNREIDSINGKIVKENEKITSNKLEIQKINNVLIPNALKGCERAIENKNDSLLKQKNRKKIGFEIEKGKIAQKIEKLETYIIKIQEQCSRACVDFINYNAV